MDNSTAQVPRLLTGTEVASALRVSTETVNRWAKADLITYVTLPNGRRRYPAEQFTQFTVTDADTDPERLAS